MKAYNAFLHYHKTLSIALKHDVTFKIPINAKRGGGREVAYGYSYKPHKAASPVAPLWQSSWFWQRCHSHKSLCSTGLELIKREERRGGKEGGTGKTDRQKEKEEDGRKRGLAEANRIPPQPENSAASRNPSRRQFKRQHWASDLIEWSWIWFTERRVDIKMVGGSDIQSFLSLK